MSQQLDAAVAELRERLDRYPPARYPVQHATAQFHLGVLLTDAGHLEEAEEAFRRALAGFDPVRLAEEHAKTLNALGALLRMVHRHDEAAGCFERAAGAFSAAGLEREQGAAHFNLGLVRRDQANEEEAADLFRRAAECFDDSSVPGQRAAALRELGTSLLALGELDAARRVLEESQGLASTAKDLAGFGGGANLLGLVDLAAGRDAAALEHFRDAAGAHPRNVRPDQFALAKANLALAAAGAGRPHRARLDARHALAIPEAAEPVKAQALSVLDAVGREAGSLARALEEEDPERWVPLIREEVARWATIDEVERLEELRPWIAHVARDEGSVELAERYLGALLELPTEDMEVLIRASVESLKELPAEAARTFRSRTDRAMARFHVPQLMRLKDAFEREARRAGAAHLWS